MVETQLDTHLYWVKMKHGRRKTNCLRMQIAAISGFMLFLGDFSVLGYRSLQRKEVSDINWDAIEKNIGTFGALVVYY